MKRCILYARVDADPAVESTTINMQLARLHRYAEANTMAIVGSVQGHEPGVNMNRDSLKQLRREVVDQRADVVLVTSFDRLSRSAFDFSVITAELEAQGVELVSLKEGRYKRLVSWSLQPLCVAAMTRGGVLA